jgi:hypothetical protein
MRRDYFDALFHGKVIFLVPIYFRDQKASSNVYTNEVEAYLKRRQISFEDIGSEYSVNMRLEDEIRFNSDMVPWRFNEIIAYLELYSYKNNVHAYLYTDNKKRNSPKWHNKIFKINIGFDADPISIRSKNVEMIVKEIIRFKDSVIEQFPKFKKYYFDFSLVLNVIELFNRT